MTSIAPTPSAPVEQEPFDASLRRRAKKVIPGGLWGHMNAARLPEGYPQYFARARGCRLWDVDDNEYVDFMCSYGPMILGYGDEDVERAAARQRAEADIANGPAPCAVELAEFVVATVPHADWVIFAKNGTDATTTCVTLARAGTGRRKVLCGGSYHGAGPGARPRRRRHREDRPLHFDYNDVASLEAAVDEAGDDLAAILVAAFRHDVRRDQELPTLEFARAARALCDRKDAALIVDDVRAGFRLHLGGSWEPLGVRPDLAAWSKAIANGRALAAVTGTDRFRQAAQEIFITGSFWCAAVPMAAALATLHKLHATDAVSHMTRMGERLRAGVEAQARRHGVGVRQTGPVQMPMVLFDDDPDLEKGNLFAATALRHGVYLHPWHNMFLSLAHGEAEIDQALEATDKALAAVAQRHG